MEDTVKTEQSDTWIKYLGLQYNFLHLINFSQEGSEGDKFNKTTVIYGVPLIDFKFPISHLIRL